MSEILMSISLFVLVVMTLVLTVLAARSVIIRQIPLQLIVNDSRSFSVMSGQSLLDALNENGILVPSACAGAGTCGLCRVQVLSGGGALLPTERAKIDRQAQHDNMRLACQVILRRETSVHVHSELLGAENWECRVVSTRMLAPFIREIVLDLPSETVPEIEAGAFVQVTVPPCDLIFSEFEVDQEFMPIWSDASALDMTLRSNSEIARAYSVANRPADLGKVVLNVRLALPPPLMPNAPPGVASSYLFSLRVGDSLRITGPYGSFRARDSGREMVVIGGGVGMAPLRAIIHDQLERVGTDRTISFWYGARSTAELFYTSELAELEERFDNFSFTVALSDPSPEDDWKGPVGFIHDIAFEKYLRDHPAPEACEYYLCGPPLMVLAVTSMLDDLGVDPDSIFNDDFGS